MPSPISLPCGVTVTFWKVGDNSTIHYEVSGLAPCTGVVRDSETRDVVMARRLAIRYLELQVAIITSQLSAEKILVGTGFV